MQIHLNQSRFSNNTLRRPSKLPLRTIYHSYRPPSLNPHITMITEASKFDAALSKPVFPTGCNRAIAVLERIAQAASATPADFSVMHLSHGTADIALEYAALYARLMNGRDRLPLSIDEVKQDNETYSDNDDSYTAVSIPMIKMANSEVVVQWPPPAQLATTASAANKAFKAIYGDAGLPFPIQDTQQEAEPVQNPATIFVARYFPEKDHNDSSYSSDTNAVLVATLATHDALRAFAVGLHQWSSERAAGVKPSEDHLGLYRLRYSSWNREADRRVRSIQSVFLPDTMKNEILRDVREFFTDETKVWYATHGIPYRRAFLLHGPPGTGKTSLVRALASELRRNCCFLSMGNLSASNEELADAMGQLPARPLVVIEDIDAVFESASHSDMSFSTLLNILDGIVSAEGVLTVMTTNHPERLDSAAIRAGRVDRSFFLGPADDAVIADCFRSFYKDADDATVEKFVSIVAKSPAQEQSRSIATLQELFIEKRAASAKKCVEETEVFLKRYAERQAVLADAKVKYGKKKKRNHNDESKTDDYDHENSTDENEDVEE